MPHQEKDPIIQIAGFAGTIAVIVSIWSLNYVCYRYDFLDQSSWRYWAIFLLTTTTIACGTNIITKKLLQHQSPECLNKWSKRVPILELALLILAIITLLSLWLLTD